MGCLDLDLKKADILKNILERYLGDLRMEIADTDNKDYREKLKEEEVVVKELIEKLSSIC